MNISVPSNISAQKGASLLITIVVMMALTVVALASTNTNQTQAFMTRNNQFRFETFNASYAEIDAQIYEINTRKLSDGVPNYIIALIDNVVGSTVSTASNTLDLFAPAKGTYMGQEAEQEYRGACVVFGQQLGAGSEKVRCNEIEIRSDASLVDSNVESEQHQVYEYKTLAE